MAYISYLFKTIKTLTDLKGINIELFGFGQEKLLLLQCAQQQTFASRRLKVNTNPVNIGNTVVDEPSDNLRPLSGVYSFGVYWIIIFDGYDLVIYGVALPLLMQEWGLSAVQAGLLREYSIVWHDVRCNELWYVV